jgi:membrane protein implicated in regulation of membrane protease activity
MSEWWSNLTLIEQIFWGIAIFATLVQLLFFVGSFLGVGDADDLDGGADADSHDGHHHGVGSLKLLSVRSILGFLTGFGWAGVLGLGSGMGMTITLILACFSGVVFALLVAITLKFVLSMTSDGTLKYDRAIGETGQVYVTIPPARSGHGKIEILLQGRLITVPALTDDTSEIASSIPVRVTATDDNGVFIVTRDSLSNNPEPPTS